MSCEKFQSIASDLARNDIVEASERMHAMAHLEECDRCGQTWANQRELSEGLRIVAEQMKTLQAPAQLEEKLRAAFRDRSNTRTRRSAPQRRRYWAAAVAAALLIAFTVVAWRAYSGTLSRQPIDAQLRDGVAAPKPTKAVATDLKPPEATPPERKKQNPRLARYQRVKRGAQAVPENQSIVEPANNQATNVQTKEVTTDFVALGYGSALDLQDGGQLVRVELPRSALVRFGLPMNMDRADERVKADVLVGADGLARAIRFVK